MQNNVYPNIFWYLLVWGRACTCTCWSKNSIIQNIHVYIQNILKKWCDDIINSYSYWLFKKMLSEIFKLHKFRSSFNTFYLIFINWFWKIILRISMLSEFDLWTNIDFFFTAHFQQASCQSSMSTTSWCRSSPVLIWRSIGSSPWRPRMPRNSCSAGRPSARGTKTSSG